MPFLLPISHENFNLELQKSPQAKKKVSVGGSLEMLISGTAKGGRPWRGSVKIEPGFVQVFFSPEKNPVKTRKKPVGKGGEYAESWGSGDVVTDRGHTTHVPAMGKTRKKTPGSVFHRPPPWPTPFGLA